MTTEFPKAIRVPVNDTPTMLNEEAVDGAIVGNVVASDGAGSGLVGALAGGVVGGLFGKARMHREYNEGRVVHAPGSAGASILMGVLIGGLLATLAGAMIFSGSGIAILAAIGLGLGGMVGYSHHKDATQNYEAAKAYYAQHGGQYQGREIEAQRDQTISPAEYRQLKERLAAAESASYAEKYKAEPPRTRRID